MIFHVFAGIFRVFFKTTRAFSFTSTFSLPSSHFPMKLLTERPIFPSVLETLFWVPAESTLRSSTHAQIKRMS